MTKYDNRLTKIIKEAGLKSYIKPSYIPYIVYNYKKKVALKDYFRKIHKGIGVVCDDIGFRELIKYCDKRCLINCGNQQFNKFDRDGMREYLSEITNEGNIKSLVFALPYRNNLEAVATAYSFELGVKIIDLYDELDKVGVHNCHTDLFSGGLAKTEKIKKWVYQILMYYEFHSSFVRGLMFSLRIGFAGNPYFLREIVCNRQRYLRNKADEYDTRKYIASLLKIKDFRLLFEERDLIREDWLNKICDKCQIMLDDMKFKIEKRQGQSVIWNWIDNVSFLKMKEDMPQLFELTKKCHYFPNTFSVMTWTSWTFKCIFSGLQTIRDKVFQSKPVGTKNEPIYKYYKELERREFSILYCGVHNYRQNFRVPMESRWGFEACYGNFLSEFQWRASTHLASNKNKKYFFIVHDLHEGHPPYMCPILDGLDKTEDQKKCSRGYMDDELKWWSQFYGNSVVVYMSDHGDVENPINRNHYSDLRCHVFFMVKIPNMEGKRYQGMLSTKDEMKVLLDLMDGKDVGRYLKDRVIVDAYDVYSRAGVDKVLDDGINNVDKGQWMQFQAIRTEADKYVLFRDGEQRYYRVGDDENNLAGDERYYERMKIYKNELEPNFININDYNFFMYSRKLYEE